jgi:transcriptional regulator with XRE-family HTH domain
LCIADRIISYAKAKGVKQTYICEQLNVDRTWLRTAKRDNINISPERLQQISELLGTTVEYLKGETDDPSKDNKKSPSELDELLNDPDFKFIFEAYRDMSPEKKKQARALFSTVKNEF